MIIDVDLAREDAEKYAANIGSLLGNVVYDLLNHPMIEEFIHTQTSGIEGLNKLLYGYNLTPMNEKWAFQEEPKIDILSHYEFIFRKNYEYGNGYGYRGRDDIDILYFLNLANVYLQLYNMNIGYLALRSDDKLASRAFEDISLNYALAVVKVESRYGFTNTVYNAVYRRKWGDRRPLDTPIGDYAGTITPRVLATLADTSLGYISQVLAENKIKARKIKGNWAIEALSALEWLQSRKNCPEWIMKLPT